MTDHVMRQPAGQTPHPMRLVPKQRTSVRAGPQFIREAAFHVNRVPAEETARNQLAHFNGNPAVLMVMPRRDRQTPPLSELDQILRLGRGNREWFFHEDVSAAFQAYSR